MWGAHGAKRGVGIAAATTEVTGAADGSRGPSVLWQHSCRQEKPLLASPRRVALCTPCLCHFGRGSPEPWCTVRAAGLLGTYNRPHVKQRQCHDFTRCRDSSPERNVRGELVLGPTPEKQGWWGHSPAPVWAQGKGQPWHHTSPRQLLLVEFQPHGLGSVLGWEHHHQSWTLVPFAALAGRIATRG